MGYDKPDSRPKNKTKGQAWTKTAAHREVTP